jgi:hypothetical protein
MSNINFGLNFYIIQMEEDSFNLYNAATDKNIIFGESKENIKCFLELNEPAHPFMPVEERENNNTLKYEINLAPMKNLHAEAESYGDIENYSFYNSDFTSNEDMQMSFVFVNDSDETSDESEESDNVLPFLPDDE